MTVLLCFGDSENRNAHSGKIFTHGIGDFGRRYEILVGDVEVAIVLEHTCVNNVGNANAIEVIKFTLFCIECARDLDGTVTAEVVEDYAVAIVDGANGLAILGNNESGEVLVNDLELIAVGLNCLCCTAELATFAKNVGLPTFFNHLPVCFITVHGNGHTTAAGCDASVKTVTVEACKEFFKGKNVIKSRGLTNVTAVKENVYANGVNALNLCLLQHCFEVIDVRVHVTVGEETEEVQSGAVSLNVGNKLLPGSRCKHLAGLDGVGNQLCALCKYLTCTESVVTNLTVTHIIVRGQTNSGAVSLERYHGVVLHQGVKVGGVCACNGVGNGIGSKTNTIHNDGENRTLHAAKILQFFKLFCHFFILRYLSASK